MKKDKLQKKIQKLGDKTKKTPSNSKLWEKLIDALEDYGDDKETLKASLEATKNCPQNAELWNSLSYSQYQNDEIDEAISSIKKAISIEPNEAYLHRTATEIYLYNNNYSEAYYHSTKAVELDGDDEDWLNHAKAASATKRFDVAIEAVDNVLGLNDDNIDDMDTLDDIARILVNCGKCKTAYNLILHSYKMCPDDLSRLEMLSWTSLHAGLTDEEILNYGELAIKLAPDDALAWMAAGYGYLAKSDWKSADKSFEKAISLGDESCSAISLLGVSLAKQGNIEVAETCKTNKNKWNIHQCGNPACADSAILSAVLKNHGDDNIPLTQTASIAELFDQLKTWLENNYNEGLDDLNPGATQLHIEELENVIGFKIPEDFATFLKIHNGQKENAGGLSIYGTFLSTTRIIEEWNIWKKLLDEDDIGEYISNPEDGVKNVWWNLKWLPFISSGAGDSICIDCDPDNSGSYGQVITLWHDMSDRKIFASDFHRWFNAYVTSLTSNNYSYSDDYGCIIETEIDD